MRFAVAVLAVVIATGLAGFAVGQWWASNGFISVTRPTVVGEASGTVDIVNQAETAMCLTQTDGEQLCGDLWRANGETIPAPGDSISVWIIRVPMSDGVSVDELILRPLQR